MAGTEHSAAEPPMSAMAHGPPSETSAYSDRVQSQLYRSIVSEAEGVGAIGSHSHLLPHSTRLLDMTHTYDFFQLSRLLSVPHHDEFSPLRQLMHSSYTHLPIGRETIDETPTAYRDPTFSQPPDLYNYWALYHHFPGPPNVICDVSSSTHRRSTMDPTLYPNPPSHQFPWSEDVQLGSVHEIPPTPTIYELPDFPLPDSPSLFPNLDTASDPYSETLDASFPCQWTNGDGVCNVMVQATRSHMNRHLHAHHGFGGSDARPTRCHWAGCGATMQQGSIARHMVTCHLQAKVTCPMCFKKLSRQDVISKHQRVCPAAGTWR